MRACKCVDSSLGDWFASSLGSSRAWIGCHCELGICKLCLAGRRVKLGLDFRAELGHPMQAWEDLGNGQSSLGEHYSKHGNCLPSLGGARTLFQAQPGNSQCKLSLHVRAELGSCTCWELCTYVSSLVMVRVWLTLYVLSLAHVRDELLNVRAKLDTYVVISTYVRVKLSLGTRGR